MMNSSTPRPKSEFILGFLFLMLGLGLLGLSLYLIPYTYNLSYQVPRFIAHARANIETYGIKGRVQMLLILLLLVLSSVICFILSRKYTTKIDKENAREDDNQPGVIIRPLTSMEPRNPNQKVKKYKIDPLIIVLLLVLAVFLLLILVEWIYSLNY